MFNRMFEQRPSYMDPQFQDGMIDIDNNTGNIDIDFSQSQSMNYATSQPVMGVSQQPIIEPMQERVVNRVIEHNVPHVCPIRTRIINRHIYRHTYQPSYSCCEENVCENVQCGSFSFALNDV